MNLNLWMFVIVNSITHHQQSYLFAPSQMCALYDKFQNTNGVIGGERFRGHNEGCKNNCRFGFLRKRFLSTTHYRALFALLWPFNPFKRLPGQMELLLATKIWLRLTSSPPQAMVSSPFCFLNFFFLFLFIIHCKRRNLLQCYGQKIMNTIMFKCGISLLCEFNFTDHNNFLISSLSDSFPTFLFHHETSSNCVFPIS